MSAAERRSAEVGSRGFRRGKRSGRFGFPRPTVVLLFAVVGFVLCSEFCFKYDRLPEQRDFPVLENRIENPIENRIENPIENRIENPIANPNENPIENPNEVLNILQREAEQKFFRGSVERPPPPRRNKRRKHSPCGVELSESVDYFLEPNDVNNFTRFQLEYVDQEDQVSLPGASEPKFGGHQTPNVRENSFNARDQTLHCGFVKEPRRHQSSGFDLDEKDLTYMKTCKIVVSSCIFGNSDYLRKPEKKKVSEYSKKNVCFVMFLDEKTLSKLSSEGDIPDEKGNIGLWRIVVVKNLPYDDMRRTGKVPKLLSHRLFPSSRYSIWIDSKMKLRTDPLRILEYFLWRTKSEYAISNHYDRHCVWEEVLQNKRLNKYDHGAIDQQFAFYQSDGLTKFDPSNPNNLIPSYVPEGSFIVRAHTPMSNLFSCLWFNEVDRFTSRDQLSFAYTYLKLRRMNPNQPFHLNMFKDCERRAITKLFHHRVMKKI